MSPLLFGDIAAQVRFERDARVDGLGYERKCDGRRLRYQFTIDVPAYDDERVVIVEFAAYRGPAHLNVHIDGPRCLRHRFSDDALCMWVDTDPPDERWVPADGLLELARHVELHAYCEAQCREGLPWPKAESPGSHPRPHACLTCRGRCSSR